MRQARLPCVRRALPQTHTHLLQLLLMLRLLLHPFLPLQDESMKRRHGDTESLACPEPSERNGMEKTDGSANNQYGSLWRTDWTAEGDKPGDVYEFRGKDS